MNVYLDSSVVLRLVLGEQGQIQGWKDFDTLVTSDLTEVECLRTMDRLRLRLDLPEPEIVVRREALFQILEIAEIVEMTRPVLKRASESFPVTLGTLDAIHLSTALLWQEEQATDVVMATHDKMLGQAARAFGMKVVGL